MVKSTMKLTRRIQLLVDLPSKEERKEAMNKLYLWRNRCYRAANLIVSHLYVQEMVQEFFYLSEGVKYKLVDEKKDELGIFNRSRINCTYRMVSDRFKGEMPTNILTNLNSIILSSFKQNREEYWSGERSLHNYKRSMAFPFDMEGVCGLHFNPDKKAFCFKFFSIPMKTYLGRDFNDKWELMHQLVSGELKMRTSHLKIKNGKIFMLATFEVEKEKHELRPEVIAEATLSLEYPIVVKIGTAKLTIGTREEFLYRRLAIQAAFKRTREGVAYARSGNGRKRKTKALERFRDKERDYVNNRLHVYSRKLIDFCVKHQAGTLVLLDQEKKIELAREEAFVLRNWSYYDLTTKIKYKAEKAAIELIVD
ncbi:hypothetical protein RM553_15370 [Zunongwangia sp. F363]|uniref:Transposase n=1 Tax=Autumnicola tepida TaxID=3075595 RepID=A0ABU3CD15_9FLAO|nr:hypothetical protein [Zunongwangia sp. F363]MDT0644216.1 hypothetical protein [Zunongwangia sp. F363]